MDAASTARLSAVSELDFDRFQREFLAALLGNEGGPIDATIGPSKAGPV